jgi:MoaA/NifB/PqqE/SkfB family radical SAM enzyme
LNTVAELKKETIEQRIDRVTLVHDRFKFAKPPAPISAKIELTAACNWACKFCIKSIRPDDRIMEKDLYLRLLDEMKEAGVHEIGVFWIGESMIVKDLPWYVKEAKDRGFFVFLTSNGAAATEDRIRKVFEAGLDSLKWSVNFYDDEQFEEIAQVPRKQRERSFKMIRAAKRIRDEGKFDCQLSASSIKFTGGQGEKMREVLEEVNKHVDRPAYFLPLYNMSGATPTNLSDWNPIAGNPGRADMMRPTLPCHTAGFTEAFVTVDGMLTACGFGTGTVDGSLVMADLKEMSFMEGWHHSKYQELRQAHLSGDVHGTACESCAYPLEQFHRNQSKRKVIEIVAA